MSKRAEYEAKTEKLVQPILDREGFSLYDIEYVKEAGDCYLRVYIDKPGGVTIDDCVTVSREMNEILDREDYIDEAYTFEVSSPGVERLLRKAAHYSAAIGHLIRVKLYKPRQGVRELVGELTAYDGETLTMRVDDQDVTVGIADIAIARMAYV